MLGALPSRAVPALAASARGGRSPSGVAPSPAGSRNPLLGGGRGLAHTVQQVS